VHLHAPNGRGQKHQREPRLQSQSGGLEGENVEEAWLIRRMEAFGGGTQVGGFRYLPVARWLRGRKCRGGVASTEPKPV
jgi:hypothetical protein